MAVVIWFITLLSLTVFSFGYIDPHLSSLFPYIAYYHRSLATIIFLVLLSILFSIYVYFLKHTPKWKVILMSVCILVFSYPALTYDLFNYITTAKVAYTYHENPYVVMPIEIANEPNLTFTRAANKVALYGPVWIALTAIPHYLGGDNVWATMLAFKIMNAAIYMGFSYLIFMVTKNMKNVVFFALNPLGLIEVIMNGHNDIYMMTLALGGLLLWSKKHRIAGMMLVASSWLIKGATLILTPLLLFVNMPPEKLLRIAYWMLSAVFFIVAPVREELYPWYAVWLVSTASLLPLKSNRLIYLFTIVLTFSLELRNLPYMWMGYYEGPGPMVRTLLTVFPVTLFFVWYVWKERKLKLS